MLDDPIKALRLVSVAEATSFLLLLVATVVKYGAGPEGGVTVLGPIHGVLFLAYCTLVLVVRPRLRWSPVQTLGYLVAAVLPVLPFLVERRLRTVPAPATAA